MILYKNQTQQQHHQQKWRKGKRFTDEDGERCVEHTDSIQVLESCLRLLNKTKSFAFDMILWEQKTANGVRKDIESEIQFDFWSIFVWFTVKNVLASCVECGKYS